MTITIQELETDIHQILGWLRPTGLPAAARDQLARCSEARQRQSWHEATELAWQVVRQARSPGQISAASDFIEGWGRMHLGAVYYCQSDFAQALDHFTNAGHRFSLDGASQNIAQFACGAAHAGLNNRFGFDQMASATLVSTMQIMGANGVHLLRKRLDERLSRPAGATPPAQGAPATALTHPMPQPYYTIPRHPITPARNLRPPRPQGFRIMFGALLLLVALIGGAIVWAWPGTDLALLPYLAILGGVSYYVVTQLRVTIPPSHALVIERAGEPTVIWGPNTFYRWPINERSRALASLERLRYQSPTKKVTLAAQEAIELRLAIYYAIDSTGQNADNVLAAAYSQNLTPAQVSTSPTAQSSQDLLPPDALRARWENRLSSDITMTLNEVLPGRTYQSLTGDSAGERMLWHERLREQLDLRTREWGIAVEELSITEIARC